MPLQNWIRILLEASCVKAYKNYGMKEIRPWDLYRPVRQARRVEQGVEHLADALIDPESRKSQVDDMYSGGLGLVGSTQGGVVCGVC